MRDGDLEKHGPGFGQAWAWKQLIPLHLVIASQRKAVVKKKINRPAGCPRLAGPWPLAASVHLGPRASRPGASLTRG